MERLVRKYEQSYRRAKEEMNAWAILQARLLQEFANATAIIERLPVLSNAANYGVLAGDTSITMTRDLPAAQMESLQLIFKAMSDTLGEFEKIKDHLEKIFRDGQQLLRAERPQPTAQQLLHRVGPRPSLGDCMDGLQTLYQMHHDEYKLKIAIVSALSYDINSEDAMQLRNLLTGEPNIPSDEVELILNLMPGGEGK